MQQLPACPARGGNSSMSCQGHFHITGAGQNLLQRSHCWGLGIVGNARNGVDAPVRHMLLTHVCRVLLGIVALHPEITHQLNASSPDSPQASPQGCLLEAYWGQLGQPIVLRKLAIEPRPSVPRQGSSSLWEEQNTSRTLRVNKAQASSRMRERLVLAFKAR